MDPSAARADARARSAGGVAGTPATPGRRAMGARIVCATPSRGRAVVNYSLGERLGRGASATVYKAIDVKTGVVVAIKQLATDKVSSVESVESEIELLQSLEHPNIVRYLGSMQTDAVLNIVLEYCESGSLAGICSRFGVFPEHLVGRFMGHVLSGLEYLHNQGTIHRDVKGANILTTKDGIAKLADFGVATTTMRVAADDGVAGVTGTPHWMAPEIVLLKEPTPACDIWSLGCTVIELHTGKPPNADLTDVQAMYATVQNDIPPLPADSSGRLRDFLMQCFQKDPNLRSSASQLLAHPWTRKHMADTAAAPDAATTVREHNSPQRRRMRQVPSRLDLGATYEQLDVSGLDIGDAPAPVMPAALKPPKGLLAFVEDADDLVGGFDGLTDTGATPAKSPADDPMESVHRANDVQPSPKSQFEPMSLVPPSSGVSSSTFAPYTAAAYAADPCLPARPQSIAHYRDDDDFEEFADQLAQASLRQPRLADRTVGEEIDPFDGVEDLMDPAPLERVVAAHEETFKLIRGLAAMSPSRMPTPALADVYIRLCELIVAEPTVKKILSQNKILAEVLPAVLANKGVAEQVLDLVLLLVEGDESMLETFSLSDGLSVVIALSEAQPLRSIILLNEFARSYSYGARLLMSRKELITFLCKCIGNRGGGSGSGSGGNSGARSAQEDEASIVLARAAECLTTIFDQFGPRKRAELWYIFGKASLFELVVGALELDPEHPALPFLYALVTSLSKTAPGLVSEFVTKHSLRQLMRTFRQLPPQSPFRTTILHFYKDISTISAVLDTMERGSLVPYFIRVLHDAYRQRDGGPGMLEASHTVAASLLPLFHNSCRLSASRQALAAKHGLIPLLQETAVVEPKLKGFSIPILCAMAHNSECWDALWAKGVLKTLVGLISERGWEAPATAAITAWLVRQPERVRPLFMVLGGIDSLLDVLRHSRNETFAAVVTSVATLVESVPDLAKAMPSATLFSSLHAQFQRHQASTTLVKLLQIVRKALDTQPSASTEFEKSGLAELVHSIEDSPDLPIISRRLAKQIGSISRRQKGV